MLDWKLEEEGGSLLLRCVLLWPFRTSRLTAVSRRTWQARNAGAAAELVSRVESLVSSEGEYARLQHS